MAGTNQALSFYMPAYPLDKIFLRPTPGSVAVTQNANPAAPAYTNVSIPHTEGATFFVDAQVSPDGGINWYDAGYEPFYLDGATTLYFPRFQMYWKVTTSNIVLSFSAYDAPYTFSYRYVSYTKA